MEYNTIEKIFLKAEKFRKHNESHLADISNEVMLAKAGDIQKYLKRLYSEEKKLDKIVPALEKLEQDKKSAVGIIKNYNKEAKSFVQDLESQADELGIDPNSFNGFKQLSIEIQNVDSYYSKL